MIFIFVVLIVNALLAMFKDDYYTTFGKYRLIAVVTDSMEPTIPTGSMIVDTKPVDENEINVGTVITFTYKNSAGDTILLTHRVVEVTLDEGGHKKFVTRGDKYDKASNNDGGTRTIDDVVGIYTGNKCGFFGSLFGFFQSGLGVSVLIFGLFVVLIAWVTIWYVNRTEVQRSLNRAALKKSAEALSNVNLRYDNINEITAVMDVLGMVTDVPRNSKDEKVISERLRDFIKAGNIELPQTPETAAILDTLPAPDTPGSLAAALSTGATLRQAEDGQTLVLTTSSGEKNIFLTPVQTPDGIILCQQGARVRTDIAPNIEDVGVLSMPSSPEFFEGQPLEKNIIYPELPQPARKLGPEELLRGGDKQREADRLIAAALAAPALSGSARIAAIGGTEQPKALPEHSDDVETEAKSIESTPKPEPNDALDADDTADAQSSSRKAYMQYREASALLELKQAEQLSALLNDTAPLSYEEQLKVAEFKAAQPKKARKSKPKTPEQIAAAKARAENRKAEREALLATLSPEDRELYLTEEKLAKARATTIRRLKRIAADRKLLEKLD